MIIILSHAVKQSARNINNFAGTFVRGTLPEVQPNAVITFSDYDEKLTRDEPGFLRSYGDRHLVVRVGEQEVSVMTNILIFIIISPRFCRFNIK